MSTVADILTVLTLRASFSDLEHGWNFGILETKKFFALMLLTCGIVKTPCVLLYIFYFAHPNSFLTSGLDFAHPNSFLTSGIAQCFSLQVNDASLRGLKRKEVVGQLKASQSPLRFTVLRPDVSNECFCSSFLLKADEQEERADHE